MRLTGFSDAHGLIGPAAARSTDSPPEPMRGLAACTCTHLRAHQATSVLPPQYCLWVTVPEANHTLPESGQLKAQHHTGTASDQSIPVPSFVALPIAANEDLSAMAARWVISEYT